MRYIEMNEAVYDYVLAHANPVSDAVSDTLAETTRERFPDRAGMNIGADQGRFLSMLVAVAEAQLVVEVGTFTGMSALWLARGLPKGGRLMCFDLTDEYLPTAREAWEAAGVIDRIEVVVGPAAEGLAALGDDVRVDLAFIDADKTGYSGYIDQLLPRLSERGLIVVDNVLWSGSVVSDDDQHESTVALRALNDDIASRDDVYAVMLPIGDGVTLIRRR
ncbi:MAG: O-methyltransferase [Ilumatobacteraceae bacterium]